MGYDTQRFPTSADEELICMNDELLGWEIPHPFSGPICGGVLQDPLEAPVCEHTFCRVNTSLLSVPSSCSSRKQICINEWLSRAPICPIDRIPIEFEQLRPVPRILRNLLNR